MDIGYFLCVICIFVQAVHSIRNTKLIAPDAVPRGHRFEMKCLYDLEQEPLYCVKWYRGDHEFARYQPSKVPPFQTFKLHGIEVVQSESDSSRLTIARATSATDGTFTCEVSADQPSFQTEQLWATVRVVDMPVHGPELHGMKDRYRVGSKLKVECVSRNSLPQANLTFFINGKQAQMSKHVWHHVKANSNKLLTATATMQFIVQRHDFLDQQIKISCLATIYSVYRKHIEQRADYWDGSQPTTTTAANFVEKVVYRRHQIYDSYTDESTPKVIEHNSGQESWSEFSFIHSIAVLIIAFFVT